MQLFLKRGWERARWYAGLAAGLAAISLLVATPMDGTGADSGAGDGLVRWGNVAISPPSENSGYVVVRDQRNKKLTLILRGTDHGVIIDAEDGTILYDDVPAGSREEIDAVLSTLTVWQGTRPAKWPYSKAPEDATTRRIGNLTFIPPDPASGIVVATVQSYGGPSYLQFSNGRSFARIWMHTGIVDPDQTVILPEDEVAFARLLSSITVGGSPRT
jgi:hypothetical protein